MSPGLVARREATALGPRRNLARTGNVECGAETEAKIIARHVGKEIGDHVIIGLFDGSNLKPEPNAVRNC